jgi:hypothetical protein
VGRDIVDHTIVGPRTVSDLANGVASEVGYLESVAPVVVVKDSGRICCDAGDVGRSDGEP